MFDTGLGFSRWLLSWADARWQTALAVPLLIGLLLLALIVLVRLLPMVDRVLGPLGAGLAILLGMVLLLPEYLCTLVLRRRHRVPPGIFYTYGGAVSGLVHVGQRISHAGLTGFTQLGAARKLLILVSLTLIVAAGNANSCAPQTSRCSPPLTAWWSQTKALFESDTTPPATTRPTKKPTRKPTPKKTR
jgi:hypothetical protein